MSELLNNLDLSDLVTSERMLGIVQAVLILVVGLLVARAISTGVARGLRRHVSAQEAMLVKRLTYYVLFALVVMSALHQLGFRLGVLRVPPASSRWPLASRHRRRLRISLADSS